MERRIARRHPALCAFGDGQGKAAVLPARGEGPAGEADGRSLGLVSELGTARCMPHRQGRPERPARLSPSTLMGVAHVPEEIALVREVGKGAADSGYRCCHFLCSPLQARSTALKGGLFQGDMAEQQRKLMVTLQLTVVASLDNLAPLIEAGLSLGRRHVGCRVKAEHYDTVGPPFSGPLGGARASFSRRRWRRLDDYTTSPGDEASGVRLKRSLARRRCWIRA